MKTYTLAIAARILGITLYEVQQLGTQGKLTVLKDETGREIVTKQSVDGYRSARDREAAARREETTGRTGLI